MINDLPGTSYGLPSACNALFNALPGSSLLLRTDAPRYTIMAATSRYLADTSTTKEQLIGRGIFEAFPNNPHDSEVTGEKDLGRSLDAVLLQKKPHYLPVQRYDVKTAAGSYEEKYWRASNDPVFNEEGDVLYIIHTVVDITDGIKAGLMEEKVKGLTIEMKELAEVRQQVEEAKKEAERQQRLYETIMSNTPDLVYVFDLFYRFTYANKALLTMWGSTWEQSIGKGLRENGYEEWHAHMHEREIDHVAATKQSIRGEVSFPHAVLGKRLYDYIFVPVLNDKGEVEAVAGTTRDITEIRLAEKTLRENNDRFRNLADDSPMFVFIIDADPQAPVTYWNKNWLVYTGLSMDEARGRAWDGIIHSDDVTIVMDHYTPAFQNRQAYFIPAVRVKRHDGVYRWHAFKGNPRYTPGGEFDGFVGVGLDIHEQKLAEDALKQSEAQLQQMVAERTAQLERTVEELKRSNNNLEEFAYAASHDLKEPVRKIHFFSDRLRNELTDSLTETQQSLFKRMEQAASRMGALIDDLLMYSHVSTGASQIEEIDLNQKLGNVLEDLELEITETGAVIKASPLPAVNGHPRQLQQLFQNLVGNAIKYRKPGTQPEIVITSQLVKGNDMSLPLTGKEQDNSYYLIQVKDNGIGFEHTDAERIFNVFTRLHGNAEYSGTGVGLSIARRVVENHRGYIWAESQPDLGSVFNVLLPA